MACLLMFEYLRSLCFSANNSSVMNKLIFVVLALAAVTAVSARCKFTVHTVHAFSTPP